MNKLSRMMLATMVLGGVKGPSVRGDFGEEGTKERGDFGEEGTRARRESPEDLARMKRAEEKRRRKRNK